MNGLLRTGLLNNERTCDTVSWEKEEAPPSRARFWRRAVRRDFKKLFSEQWRNYSTGGIGDIDPFIF